MARKPRLDAPGALHHIIARGIDRQRIFTGHSDCMDFVRRVAEVANDLKPQIYAWVLMPTHFHLLLRTGNAGLSTVMRRLMTGYAVGFNLRHTRSGHLFQNRYKSLLCQDDPYLLELTRYIHLNPVRAGLLSSLEQLDVHPWCGHAVLMGKATYAWQNVDAILSRFGPSLRVGRRVYRDFLEDGLSRNQPAGDLHRSIGRESGEWSRVLSRQRRSENAASDTRVLGSDDFVESVVAEAERLEKNSLRLMRVRPTVDLLCGSLALGHDLEPAEVTSGAKRRKVIKARKDVVFIAMKKLGYSGAEVARHLGVSASCINRIAAGSELSPVGKKILDLLKT